MRRLICIIHVNETGGEGPRRSQEWLMRSRHRHRHTQIASSIILFPSGKHINLYFTECIFQHIQDTPRTCFTLATVTKGKGVDGVDGGGGGGGGCRMVEVVVEVVEAVVVEKEGVSSTVDRMPCCRFEIISNKID